MEPLKAIFEFNFRSNPEVQGWIRGFLRSVVSFSPSLSPCGATATHFVDFSHFVVGLEN